MTEILMTVAQSLMWLVGATAFAFVARYAMHTWWRTFEGRNLMAVTLVVAVTYTLSALMPWLRVSDFALAVIACVVFAAMLAVLIQRHWLLTRADREAREKGD